jgi:hypothetical protein
MIVEARVLLFLERCRVDFDSDAMPKGCQNLKVDLLT